MLARAAMAALLVCGMAGAAAQGAIDPVQLPLLERLVRSADARALPALLAAQNDMPAHPYPDRIAYLKLLRRAYGDHGDVAAANDTAERIVRMAQTQRDRLNMALGQLGRLSAPGGHVQPGALAAVNDIDVRYPDLRDPAFTAALQRAYAEAYLDLGQFDFAQSHYLKGLEIARQHPELLDPTANMLRLGLAKVYVYTDAPDKVLATVAQIDAGGGVLAPPDDTRRHVIEGIAHVMQGRTEQGRVAYRAALGIAHAHGLALYEASALANLADSWLEDGQYVEAERAARAGLALAEQAGDAPTRRVAEGNLGFALAGQGHLAEGLAHIDRVLAEQRAANSLPDMANVLREKSRMLEKAGLVRQALQALQEQREVAGKLAAAEHANTARVLQDQFNVQRRAIEIEGLRRENVLKDAEIHKRRVWQVIASTGTALALLLCGFVWRLYRRSMDTSRQLRELNAELAFHSTHDALTGLLNRRSFRDAMAARAPGAGRCFILLDIDHFKSINDRLGHATGDQVLVAIADTLTRHIRSPDMLARVGGEEFMVLIPQGDESVVRDIAERLRRVVERQEIAPAASAALVCTVSIGYCISAQAQIEWQKLVVIADQALYAAKRGGRNRVTGTVVA